MRSFAIESKHFSRENEKYLFINQLLINNYIWVVAEIFYW